MKSNEIIKMLEVLVGETTATGKSEADWDIEYNLKVLIDIADWCLDGVYMSAVTRHDLEGGKRSVGERAFSAMCEWKDWLDNRIKEL